MRLDIEAGRCRLLVVDAQVQRGNRTGAIGRELHGHAAALIQHGRDDTAMQDARPCITDEDRTIRQARPGFARGGAVEAEPADLPIDGAMAFDSLDEFVERQWRGADRCVGHGNVLDQCPDVGKNSRTPFPKRFQPSKPCCWYEVNTRSIRINSA